MHINFSRIVSAILVLVLLLATASTPAASDAVTQVHTSTALPEPQPFVSATAAPAQARLERDWGQLPLYFVENQGQLDERVAYTIQGSDKTIYFAPDGVTFALTERPLRTIDDEGRDIAWRDEQGLQPASQNLQSAIVSFHSFRNPHSEIRNVHGASFKTSQ